MWVWQPTLLGFRQERDLLREEIQQTQVTLQQLKTQLYEQETTIQSDAATAHETQRNLEDSLKDESHKREELEKECKHLNEVSYVDAFLHYQCL